MNKWKPKALIKFSYIEAFDEALSKDGYYQIRNFLFLLRAWCDTAPLYMRE